MEAAAARRIDRARDVPLEHDPLALRSQIRIRDRDRREQRLGVRHDRPRVELLGRRELDDLAEVHHGDPVAHVADDSEVVRDEDVGELELVLQVVEQVQHLRLDGDVECRDGLVRDDQLRPQGERARDPDSLPLAAGELMREAVVVLRREADGLENLPDALLLLGPVAQVVNPHRVGDDRPHALARVERRVRILEDHLDLAPKRAQLPRSEMLDRPPLEDDLAVGRLEQAHDRAAQRRLAAAGLTHEPERLPFANREAHVVDGVHARDLALHDP